MIRLIRSSDKKEFKIDDDDREWKATKIEGIDALTLNVYTEAPAIGTGEIVTGKYTGRRDISVTAHRSSHINISEARSIVMDFFDPDDTYTMEIKYNGKDLYIDCELLAYKLPTENINRPLDLTFTMLCPDPYFYLDRKFTNFNFAHFTVDGSFDVFPTISITLLYNESDLNIYIDDNDPIHIVLPIGYFPNQKIPPSTLTLNCKNGKLAGSLSSSDLTNCIQSGNPKLSFKPGNNEHTVRFVPNNYSTTSGTLTISNSCSASVTMANNIREVRITFPDGISQTYPPGKYTYWGENVYSIEIVDSELTVHGAPDKTIVYTALLGESLPGKSTATVSFREIYRGF